MTPTACAVPFLTGLCSGLGHCGGAVSSRRQVSEGGGRAQGPYGAVLRDSTRGRRVPRVRGLITVLAPAVSCSSIESQSLYETLDDMSTTV